MGSEFRHRVRLLFVAAALIGVLAGSIVYGFGYYTLDAKERVVSEKHRELRPSGSIGVKLGMLGAALFFGLYAYPVRKRWKWLQRFGKTKHWLDFHVLLGITAPLVITIHSSFKLQGLAGVAYWLMIIVMLSGFVGRYFYAQFPRSLSAAELSLSELVELSAATRREIESYGLFSADELEQVLKTPDAARVEHMSLIGVLASMICADVARPFRVAAIRRKLSGSFIENIKTIGGLFASSNAGLEDAVALVRRQSWLVTKMAFLGRASQVFQLWHVVHRPFSYSFAVLAILHITLVLLMGYF